MKQGIAILLIAFVVAACNVPDTVELPKTESRTVLNCIGFNNHPWQAYVSTSHDILTVFPQEDPIDNVTIKLYQDGLFVETFTLANGGGFFQSTVSTPQPGRKYRITAERPGYLPVESEFQQPDSIVIQSADLHILGPGGSPFFGTDVQVRVTFDDPIGEDFYEFDAIQVIDSTFYWDPVNDTTLYLQAQQLRMYFIDPAYSDNNEIFYNTAVTDDSFFDGKQVILDFKVQIQEVEKKTFVVYLRHLSKEYFLYMKTSALQYKNQHDAFAQQVLIENNITNGYGVFGGFTQTKKIVKRK